LRELIYEGQGRVAWHESADPAIQGPRHAIVRPIASSACDLDQRIIAGATAFEPPFALGHECVAEVVEIGEGVTTVQPGDVVVLPWKPACGECRYCLRGLTASCEAYGFMGAYGLPLGANLGGFFSDLVLVPFADAMLVPVPPDVDPLALAAAGDNLTDAFMGVGKGLAKNPGGRVLVVGGTGSLGLYAADMAQALGASQVVYIDDMRERRAIAASLGASVHEDFHDEFIMGFDVVAAATRDPAKYRQAFLALAPGGHLASLAIYFGDQPVPLWEMYKRDVSFSTGKPSTRPHIPDVVELCRCGKIHPEKVTTHLIAWEDAPEQLPVPAIKAIVHRAPIHARRNDTIGKPATSGVRP